MRVDVYSRHDSFICTIPEDNLYQFTHSDTNNGEDSVSITTTTVLREGYRLVWKDDNGVAHEHVCQDPRALHAEGLTLYSDTALNSICELFYDYIEDKRPYSYTFSQALSVALEPTRWSAGTVDQEGTVASGLTFYHTSAREALQAILDCGGELRCDITVDGSGVTSRAVSILAHRGESNTHKRFAYGKDIQNVSKTEHWGAITACYGYGKGVETDSGGYGRKLTFGDINNNKNYVEDATALKAYGRPNGKGGFSHLFGEYENSECEDASQLLAETKAYLEEHKVPGVTYKANVIDLLQFGRTWEGVGVGDDVQLVDSEFEPELRLTGRVSKLTTDYINKTKEITLGNVTETMASMYAKQQAELKSLSIRSSNWDATTSASPNWLQTMMDGLNEQFNTSGINYKHESFEHGTIWASVPMDENGNPTKTGGTAIQLCSQGQRLAKGTKSDGSWDWAAWGTGAGYVADAITAGTLDAGKVTIKDLMHIGDQESSIDIDGAGIYFNINDAEAASIVPTKYMNTVVHFYPGSLNSDVYSDKLYLAEVSNNIAKYKVKIPSILYSGRFHPYLKVCFGNETFVGEGTINTSSGDTTTSTQYTTLDEILTDDGWSCDISIGTGGVSGQLNLQGVDAKHVYMTVTINSSKYGLLSACIQYAVDATGVSIEGRTNSLTLPSEFVSSDNLFNQLSNIGGGNIENRGGYTGVLISNIRGSLYERNVYTAGVLVSTKKLLLSE